MEKADTISAITGIGYGPYIYDTSWPLAYSENMDTQLGEAYRSRQLCLAFLVPIVIRVARKSRFINAEKMCRILKKRGFSPVSNGDEMKQNEMEWVAYLAFAAVVRLKLSRENDLPPILSEIEGLLCEGCICDGGTLCISDYPFLAVGAFGY